MKLLTFSTTLLAAMLVVIVLEFILYTNIPQPVAIDTELPLVSVDTLYKGVVIVTGVNNTGERITVTINTENYQPDDNMKDELGNSSTYWSGNETDTFGIKTNNSTITYVITNDTGWYKVTSVLYEIR